MIASAPKVSMRDYQQACIDATHTALIEHDRALIVMATGAGKACVAATLARDCLDRRGAFCTSKGHVLILVNREELLQQMRSQVQRFTGIYAALERASDRAPEDAPIVIATIQSIQKRLDRFPHDRFALVICFEGDTPVVMADGTSRQIKDIRVGDLVLSRNLSTGITESRKVTAAGQTGVAPTFKVSLEDGRSVKCTESHLFYTQRGYVEARHLTKDDSVLSYGNNDARPDSAIVREPAWGRELRSGWELREPAAKDISRDKATGARLGQVQDCAGLDRHASPLGEKRGVRSGARAIYYSCARFSTAGVEAVLPSGEKASKPFVARRIGRTWSCLVADGRWVPIPFWAPICDERLQRISERDHPGMALGKMGSEIQTSVQQGEVLVDRFGQGKRSHILGSGAALCDSKPVVQTLRRELEGMSELQVAILSTGAEEPLLLKERVPSRLHQISEAEILPNEERGDHRKAASSSQFASFTPTGDTVPVYDITVEGNHNFFANGMLVHNCDEAHLFASPKIIETLDHFCSPEDAKLLGFTATPQTKGKRALSKIYETIAYEKGIASLIEEKWLCNIKVQTVPVKIDLASVRTAAGDFIDEDLDAVVTPYFHELAKEMKKHPDRKWLCFLPLIATSRHFCDVLNAEGIPAQHVDGKSEDRKEILIAFKEGKFKAMCNSLLVTTGYDEPTITGIVNLRPTKSRIMISQILGRGTRLKPEGSPHSDLLVLDPLWQSPQLEELMTPASLFSVKEEDEKEASKRLRSGDELDLAELHAAVVQDRHKKLADALKANEAKAAKLMDFAQILALGITKNHLWDELIDYEPVMESEKRKPTEGQMSALIKMGVDVRVIKDRGHANRMFDFCVDRIRRKLATFKQVRALQRAGYHVDPDKLGITEASHMLARLYGK